MCYHCDAGWHRYWKRTHVCFQCRLTARGIIWLEQQRRCPQCRTIMTPMPLSFRTPKKMDTKSWEEARQEHSRRREDV